jgi:uncharacterized membrane protein YczE
MVTSPPFIMARRITQLLIGLFFFGLGIALMVRGSLGVPPWDVLTLGIQNQTGWEFGIITIFIGFVVLLLWIPIRQKPGLGTILNVVLVGPSAQVCLWLIPEQTDVVPRILLVMGGLLLIALATGLYIGARFGPGPRDGLMTGIHARFGWKIWIVRTSIEVVALTIGWLLGGDVGFGTLAFALLIGPMVHRTIPFFMVPAAVRPSAAPAAAL